MVDRKKLDILAQVPSHISVCVIGEGPLKTKLRELFANKANIKLAGAMPNEQVLDFLQRARILIHCADDEGLPRVFGEALACGTPIIASDRLLCGTEFPQEYIFQAKSDRLVQSAVEKLEDESWLQRAGLIGRQYMQQNHSFIRTFSLFSEALKHLCPEMSVFLP